VFLHRFSVFARTVDAGPDQQTAGPASPAERDEWFKKLEEDRDATIVSDSTMVDHTDVVSQAKIGYKGGVFDTPELQWTQTSFIQPQMHPYDRQSVSLPPVR